MDKKLLAIITILAGIAYTIAATAKEDLRPVLGYQLEPLAQEVKRIAYSQHMQREIALTSELFRLNREIEEAERRCGAGCAPRLHYEYREKLQLEIRRLQQLLNQRG